MEMTMKKPDYEKAVSEVKRILDENYIAEPPVLVHELAENYGLLMFASKFDDTNVAGMLDIDNKSIFVNKNDSLERQAFTIAHEFGHWILHVKNGDMKNEEILYRRPLKNPDETWMEQEANCFAANLLIPTEMLKKYERLSQKEVANIFRVSTSVIGYRRLETNE